MQMSETLLSQDLSEKIRPKQRVGRIPHQSVHTACRRSTHRGSIALNSSYLQSYEF